MIELRNLKDELKGESLFIEKSEQVIDYGRQIICKVQGMYACCGVGVLSNMKLTMGQFERISKTLHDVIEHNNEVDAGVGAYIATTGDAAGISPDWFEDNEHWERMTDFPNPVHDGTELQIWVLK